jgi:hypothetical protein
MKNLTWFVLGVIGGFVAAHLVNKNPAGHEALAEVDARIGEFTDRIADAYHAQEAQFASFLDDAKSVAGRAAEAATDAAARTASSD